MRKLEVENQKQVLSAPRKLPHHQCTVFFPQPDNRMQGQQVLRTDLEQTSKKMHHSIVGHLRRPPRPHRTPIQVRLKSLPEELHSGMMAGGIDVMASAAFTPIHALHNHIPKDYDHVHVSPEQIRSDRLVNEPKLDPVLAVPCWNRAPRAKTNT
jgi:hypothetical protein